MSDTLLKYYNRCMQFTGIGFAVFDVDGTIVASNDMFAKIVGINEKEIMKKKIDDCLGFDESVLDKYLSLNADSVNLLLKASDSKKIYHCSIGKLICEMRKECGFITIKDNEENIKIVNDIMNNLSQILTLIDNDNIGFAILDQNHNIIDTNRTFAETLGYTKKEILKMTAWDYVYDFHDNENFRDFKLYDTFSFFKDNYHVKKNGEKIPVKAVCSVGTLNNQRITLCLYTNITEQMESNQRLQEREMMLQNFIQNSSDVIFCLNKDKELTYISPNAKQIFGYHRNLSMNQISKQYLPLLKKEFVMYLERVIHQSSKVSPDFEYSISSKSTKTKFYSVSISIPDNNEMIICYVRDVTKDKEYIEELKLMSYTDQLTSLFNRKFMEEQLIKFGSETHYPISIISADLDGLKVVNDTLGHQAGDELLKLFANTLKSTQANVECIFRIGGDEFLIVSPNSTEQTAEKIIKDIEDKITKYNQSPRSLLKISVSIGSATAYESSISLQTLLARADREMYAIKNAKKAQ